jgi:hypothetical protein
MGTESITKFNEYNERLNKYNAIKKLYTDPILHRKLMTFETEHFNILLEEAIEAYINAFISHYPPLFFIEEQKLIQLEEYIERVQGE